MDPWLRCILELYALLEFLIKAPFPMWVQSTDWFTGQQLFQVIAARHHVVWTLHSLIGRLGMLPSQWT